MGIRETINQKPQIVTLATVLIIVVALGYIVFQFIGGSGSPSGSASSSGDAFYSTDDGKTYFADDASNMPPFEKNGQKAYRAYVFTCDGGKTKFVSYLERIPDAAMAEINKLKAQRGQNAPPPSPSMLAMIAQQSVEIKQPGQAKWISKRDPAAQAILAVKCPDGQTGSPDPILP
jgi:hypothetical protein